MLSIRYLRPITATAERQLQAAIAELLRQNPSVEDPVPLMWNLRPMCGNRWQVILRAGALWFYRNCEQITVRRPVAVLFAGAQQPAE